MTERTDFVTGNPPVYFPFSIEEMVPEADTPLGQLQRRLAMEWITENAGEATFGLYDAHPEFHDVPNPGDLVNILCVAMQCRVERYIADCRVQPNEAIHDEFIEHAVGFAKDTEAETDVAALLREFFPNVDPARLSAVIAAWEAL